MLKRVISLVMFCVTVFAAVSGVFSVKAVTVGDINSDGYINMQDCALMKRAVLGLSVLSANEKNLADMNGDGEISVFDYILMKRTVLGTLDAEVSFKRTESISRGKKYTTSVSADATYPDTYSSELTDGAVATSASYTNGAFCGYTANVDVTIDLGSNGNDIVAFELSYLSVNEAGILPPSSVYVYGSDSSSSSGTYLGVIRVPSYTLPEVASVTLNLNTPVDYRYIRFSVRKASHWVFIDECIVYASVTVSESEIPDTPDKLYENETITDSVLISNLNSVASGNVYNPELGEKKISASSVSVSSSGTDSRCGTNKSVLIDGYSIGTAYDSGRWYGISASADSTLILTLGTTYSDINSFSLHCFNRSVSSVELPPCVEVAVSSNGYTYTTIGRMYSIKTSNENYSFTLTLDKLIRAKYVKFTLKSSEGYYWIEEAEVYQNAIPSNSYVYGTFDMPLAENSTKWLSIEYDYNDYINLALGLRPEILSDSKLSLSSYNAYNGTEYEADILTDGNITDSVNCSDSSWFSFYKGDGRSIFFDLGRLSSVSEIGVGILKNSSQSANLPATLKVVLSENGEDWYSVGNISLSSADKSIYRASLVLSNSYKARYVAICFPVTNYVFVDEIEIYGTKSCEDALSLVNSDSTTYDFDFGSKYIAPSEDLLGGASDILLVYHTIGIVDKEMLLPYVAYIDKNGNVTDTMYDGFLFLPSPGYLPSGGTPYGTNNVSDWNYLFNKLFTTNRDFDALDRAVSEAKKLLGLSDYKVQVYVTIPHLDSSLYGSSFGDIDGDGNNEDLRYLENRVYVSKYYAEKVISTFNSKNYKNLELGGFYWFHETITPNSNDAKTAQQLNEEFDAMDIDLFWIPYYRATGYSSWSTFGFDAAFYQPNYAFGANIDESRLQAAASEAQTYSMTMEMEIDSSAVSDIRFFRKYMDYLAGGVKYGYIRDAMIAYYQNFDDIGSASRSENDRIRLIYDYTYAFIKGSLDITPDAASEMSFETKSGYKLTGTLNSTDSSALEYKVAISAQHGTVTVGSDGSFVYYPNKGFTGTDTFTYRIGNYLGWSEECIVTIKVG